MNKGILMFFIGKSSLAIVACVIFWVIIIKNGKVIDCSEIKDTYWRESALPYEKLINTILISLLSMATIAVIALTIPLFKDIPYVINGAYMKAEGTVLTDEMGGSSERVQDRVFLIKEAKSGDEIQLKSLTTGIRKGEYVYVTYLPNSGLATINDRQKSELQGSEIE